MIAEVEVRALFGDGDLFAQGGNYVGGWGPSVFTRWSAGREREADVTSALAAAKDPLSDVLIRFLRREAQLEYDREAYTYELVSAKSGQLGFTPKKAPDLFVVRYEKDANTGAQAEFGTMDLAIEFKRGAKLNGGVDKYGRVYCPDKHGRGGNQLVCYQAGCWKHNDTIDPAAFEDNYLFVAPSPVLVDFPHHLSESWHAYTRLKPLEDWEPWEKKALADEVAAKDSWKVSSTEALADELETRLPDVTRLDILIAALRKRY
jgi:hypothetical protein